MLRLSFSFTLDWGSYIVFIAKTAPNKIEALIRSMIFLSPDVALYLYKSTIPPWMEYCCHIWAGTPTCYLDILQKWVGTTDSPPFAASLGPLGHRWNVASLSNFYRYYFCICCSELSEMVPLPHSRGRSICYSKSLYGFSVSIPKWYKDFMSTVSLLAQLDSGILCPHNAFLWLMI